MKKQFLFFIVLILLAQEKLKSQNGSLPDTPVIRVMAKAYGDSIVLRWAPSTPGAWQLLNKTGYQVLRMSRNSADGKWTALNSQPIIPSSLEAMKKTLDRNNKYAAIAAQALYGKSVTTAKNGMAPVITQGADDLNNRYALALQSADYSAAVADAIGLRWTDKQVVAGEAYVYRIVAAKPIPNMKQLSSSLVVVNQREANLKPEGLVVFGGDRKVELQWPRHQPESYSGYQVEISEDGKNYKALHESPYYTSLPDTANLPKDSALLQLTDLLQQQHVLIDSIKKNYQPYFYRVRGINSFGEWSAYSDPVVVSGRDLTPPSSILLGTPEVMNNRSMKLSWNKPVKESDLKGYYVYRSSQVDGGFTLLHPQLLSVDATGFTDPAPFEHGPNFYMVAAVDTAGNQNPSFPVMGLLPDTTAPEEPTELKGNIDREGLVHLSWKMNPEEDIKGYKVYFAHERNQPFTQITLYPTSENQFTDSITLKTLTKKIYYRIVAVDQNNNHSDYSDVLELKKPDIIPPTPPVILDATIIPGAAQLQFSNSASKDAIHYLVMRREAGGDWKQVARIAHSEKTDRFSFSDTTIKHGIVYEYAGKTVDEDGLISELSTPARLQLRGAEILSSISFTKAFYDAQQNAVVLQWNYTTSEPFYFVIYRSLAGAQLERYRTLEKGTREWKDFQVTEMEKGYRYAIQAVYQNNSKMTSIGEGILVKK